MAFTVNPYVARVACFALILEFVLVKNGRRMEERGVGTFQISSENLVFSLIKSSKQFDDDEGTRCMSNRQRSKILCTWQGLKNKDWCEFYKKGFTL